MQNILYRLNNNTSFNVYSYKDIYTEEDVTKLKQDIISWNGTKYKVKVIVVDNGEKVVLTSDPLDKSDLKIINNNHWKLKRGIK